MILSLFHLVFFLCVQPKTSRISKYFSTVFAFTKMILCCCASSVSQDFIFDFVDFVVGVLDFLNIWGFVPFDLNICDLGVFPSVIDLKKLLCNFHNSNTHTGRFLRFIWKIFFITSPQ